MSLRLAHCSKVRQLSLWQSDFIPYIEAMTDFVIRLAQIHDSNVLHRLWLQKQAVLKLIAPNASSMLVIDWDSSFTGWLEDAHTEIYVAMLHSNAIVGFIVVRYMPNGVGKILEMVTELHTIQGGIGRCLWQHAQEQMQAAQVDQVKILAHPYYAVEQAFWMAMGAQKNGDELWIR